MNESVIAHYRVLRKLGEGGMGEVYLAEDTRLRRQVALKVLAAVRTEDRKWRQRFLSEARSASVLNHPNVCVIYEVGETAEQRPYLAMEYVEGLTLQALLREGPLGLKRVVELAIQLADALDAAYVRGIVHRDLKPANICLTERGQVKVLDFGLAKRFRVGEREEHDATTHHQTAVGEILGTPAYMSPEQAVGRPVDHRTDTFSLGVVLYEMVTRQQPFRGESWMDIMHRVVHAAAEPMSRFNPQVPVDLERVVSRCLEKDPARRYQLPQELLADLKAVWPKLEAERAAGEADVCTLVGDASGPAGGLPATLALAEVVKESDIFINCALIDDQPLSADQRGWVSQLQRHLEVRLEQLWGEPVKIGRYPMPPGDPPVHQAFFDELVRVKTMISVVSPPFMKAEGCRREVAAFYQHAQNRGGLSVGDKSRLFKVVKTPVESRSRNGLIEAVRQSKTAAGSKLLLVVDQFEELFRFNRASATSQEEAIQFVNLLLQATQQSEQHVYVVLTMRSDFLGECSQFLGLAEAVNDGEFLIPRMTRDQIQEAIEGPIRVRGATIAPRLLFRLLNDVEDNQDQLPVLQHALMRTWDLWAKAEGRRQKLKSQISNLKSPEHPSTSNTTKPPVACTRPCRCMRTKSSMPSRPTRTGRRRHAFSRRSPNAVPTDAASGAPPGSAIWRPSRAWKRRSSGW